MIESISKIDVYIGLAINGAATGLGSAIGAYLANKHIIEKSQAIINKLRGVEK